ncbi:BRCA1 C terminus domain-containing protein [Xylariaceae sp. FL0255]|nr:BRCA1 C terminus domain-containing protein [Xylariaceae sp. FL0255]
MAPPPKPNIPKAAEPVHGQSFDPWNSSSTGHQRAENRLGASTGWRDSRSRKLMSQFTGGAGGGPRVSDTVGPGAADWDPKAEALVTRAARARAQTSVLDMLAKPGNITRPLQTPSAAVTISGSDSRVTAGEGQHLDDEDDGDTEIVQSSHQQPQQPPPRKLFDGVVVYVNGSTFPLISDHKLKHVLADHGAQMSSHLGRRKVTHVILGRPAAGSSSYRGGSGSGGGLPSGKLQREIQKVSGAGVKYVSVEWVLESIKVGKRLPEARFADLKVAPRAQGSVYGLFSTSKSKEDRASPSVDDFQPPPSGQR